MREDLVVITVEYRSACDEDMSHLSTRVLLKQDLANECGMCQRSLPPVDIAAQGPYKLPNSGF